MPFQLLLFSKVPPNAGSDVSDGTPSIDVVATFKFERTESAHCDQRRISKMKVYLIGSEATIDVAY